MKIKGHKAYQIDVATRTIKDIVIRDWTQIRDFIGEECESFTCPISFPSGDTIYADDEGLFNPIPGGIVIEESTLVLVGNIVVLGADFKTGESKDVVMTKEDIRSKIKFITAEAAQAYADHITTGKPLFRGN
jgi:hypothetical protein